MLYAITDNKLTPTNSLLVKAEAALKGGCQWLQYRDKSDDKSDEDGLNKSQGNHPDNHQRRVNEARGLLELCIRYGAKLIINDDVGLAIEVGAHGVHLGQDDGSVMEARRRLGAKALVGVTCHDSLDLAELALRDGASYLAFGRFFPSLTKPNAKVAPLELLGQTNKLRLPNSHQRPPIVAIGGITLANAAEVIAAGATAIAVCHNLFAGDDIETRARDLSRLADVTG
jgi:thiamine-phosphate pyrophosphorylase